MSSINWKTCRLSEVEDLCRRGIEKKSGISVSPKWLLTLIHAYRLLTREADETGKVGEHGYLFTALHTDGEKP
jgi:hypothetical protein